MRLRLGFFLGNMGTWQLASAMCGTQVACRPLITSLESRRGPQSGGARLIVLSTPLFLSPESTIDAFIPEMNCYRCEGYASPVCKRTCCGSLQSRIAVHVTCAIYILPCYAAYPSAYAQLVWKGGGGSSPGCRQRGWHAVVAERRKPEA